MIIVHLNESNYRRERRMVTETCMIKDPVDLIHNFFKNINTNETLVLLIKVGTM